MPPKSPADELADWMRRPDTVREAAEQGDPYEHVRARAEAIHAFASAMLAAPREQWRDHDLATLNLMYEQLAEQPGRLKVAALAAAAAWLEHRETGDPAQLVAELARVDWRFARVRLGRDELAMLRGGTQHAFEARRVVAALALGCGALDFKQCDRPLDEENASDVDKASDAIKQARKRYR